MVLRSTHDERRIGGIELNWYGTYHGSIKGNGTLYKRKRTVTNSRFDSGNQ